MRGVRTHSKPVAAICPVEQPPSFNQPDKKFHKPRMLPLLAFSNQAFCDMLHYQPVLVSSL
jgi:hypothetical protein